MTSIASVHPGEGSSSVALLKVSSTFFPRESFFSVSWEFFLIRCEVKGQGCRMCTDCKAQWGTFVICGIGLYIINWIEWWQGNAWVRSKREETEGNKYPGRNQNKSICPLGTLIVQFCGNLTVLSEISCHKSNQIPPKSHEACICSYRMVLWAGQHRT